ncbi:MAG TPA: ferritin family protein [Desulfotignum sp.]|nr:ferritin family protein [Desulfotignum sp.]
MIPRPNHYPKESVPMFTPNDLIDIAAKMEKNGQTIYLESKKKVTSPRLKSLLQWMADEESAHREWFLEQKDTWTSTAAHTDLETMLPDVIKEMMGDKTLSLDDVDFSKIRSASDMLDTFVTFENDTILFYEFLQAFVQDTQALAGLEKIIKEEKNHVEKLTDMIQAISTKKIREQTLQW